MKKKILSATFVVAMMAVAGYNVYMSQAKADMSELALANLEALAGPFKQGTIFQQFLTKMLGISLNTWAKNCKSSANSGAPAHARAYNT